MPKVSVVLPTFERWPLLSRALSSVLEQTEADLEVLVIDDCSSDETPARLAAVADPRLRVLRQDPNQGVARARNRAIAEARGEWIAILDDDEFWAPTRLGAHLRAIADAGASWGYGAAISVGLTGARRVMMPAPPDTLEGRSARQRGRAAVDGDRSPRPAARGRLLRRRAKRDRRLGPLGAAVRRAPAALCETPLVAYWEHVAAMHHQHRPEMSAELEYLADKHQASDARRAAIRGPRGHPQGGRG